MLPAAAPRILVVGGYGAFGIRAAERLVRTGSLEVVVAGRSLEQARMASIELSRGARAAVMPAALDAMRPDIEALRSIAPAVILNASGPFQTQNYALARAAIAIGAHYVDLADSRAFVTGIDVLDEQAKSAGVLVLSGASSVPALSAAIVDHYSPYFSKLTVIEHGITPGNGYDPGEATAASILGGLGKPFQILVDGQWTTVHGWLGLRRLEIPGLGARWMAHCDVPDVVLFPKRYRGVQTVRFSAGLEVSLFQLSLWVLALAAKNGLVKRPERLARPLMVMKRALRFLGSDAGGMVVRLEGLGRDARPLVREIDLVARQNQGPYVPVIAAVIVAGKLARGSIEARGAMPCLGFMRLPEFTAEVADLDIEISERNHPV